MPRPRTGFTYDLSLQARSLRRRVRAATDVEARSASARSSKRAAARTSSGHPPAKGATEPRRWIALGPSATAELTGNRVLVSGELDLTESRSLQTYLDGLGQGPEVIDCTAVSFVGAAGLTALLAATRAVSPPLILASPALVRMARLCSVDGVFGIPTPH